VATVAINGSKNAGILAAQIIALKDDAVRYRLEKYKFGLARQVEEKDSRLRSTGIENYLAGRG